MSIKNLFSLLIALVTVFISLQACTYRDADRGDTTSIVITNPPVEKVITAQEQAALTPDTAIQSLKEGNRRFVNNDITARNHSAVDSNPGLDWPGLDWPGLDWHGLDWPGLLI